MQVPKTKEDRKLDLWQPVAIYFGRSFEIDKITPSSSFVYLSHLIVSRLRGSALYKIAGAK